MVLVAVAVFGGVTVAVTLFLGVWVGLIGVFVGDFATLVVFTGIGVFV